MRELKIFHRVTLVSFVLLFMLVGGADLCGVGNTKERDGVEQSKAKDDVVIITNIPTNVSVSKKELKSVFLGKKTTIDRHTVVIAIQKNGETHKRFLKKYIDKTPSQYKMYWKQKVFSGAGHFPKTFQSEESLIAYVARTKGAIGYINSREKVKTDKVKFVQIEEKISRTASKESQLRDRQSSLRGK